MLTSVPDSYVAFGKAFNDGDTVFYAAADDNGDREAGYGIYRNQQIVNRVPTATLFKGAYNDKNQRR